MKPVRIYSEEPQVRVTLGLHPPEIVVEVLLHPFVLAGDEAHPLQPVVLELELGLGEGGGGEGERQNEDDVKACSHDAVLLNAASGRFPAPLGQAGDRGSTSRQGSL